MTQTTDLPHFWQEVKILWISPFDVLPPADPHDEEQVSALKVFITPVWDLSLVPPVPVADEGRPQYRAVSGAHRLGAAREVAEDDKSYLVPCIPIPCPPFTYDEMMSVDDWGLADILEKSGLHAAALASRPRLHRLPSSDS